LNIFFFAPDQIIKHIQRKSLNATHQHRAIKRRDALLEIERRSLAIQAMLNTPIWET